MKVLKFKDKKQRGRPKVLNKEAKIILKRQGTKEELEEVVRTTVNKLKLEQVHEK